MSCPNMQVARFQSPHVHVCADSYFSSRKPGRVPHVGITLHLHLCSPVDAVQLEEVHEERTQVGRGRLLVLHRQRTQPARDTCDKIVQAPTVLLSLYPPLLVQQSKPHNVSLRSPPRVST